MVDSTSDAASPGPTPGSLPLFVFDGDCAFCRASIERWREAVGQQVAFAPYQEVAPQFPNIGEQQFKREAHFIDSDGRVSRGAEAFFAAAAHCGRKQWVLELYAHFRRLRRRPTRVYRAVAANRPALATLRRIWWGKDLRRPTYHIASALFVRLIGLVYLIAIVSLWTQIDGLVGDHGILPASKYLEAVEHHFAQLDPSASPVWNIPTLAWISPHDWFLNFLCAAGSLLSLMVIAGVLPMPALALLWLIYLSLFHAGQTFLTFQWDILLLEAGLIAMFVAPFVVRSKFLADRHPPRLAIWLIWWLLFRLMFESGVVKLTWNHGMLENGLPIPNTWQSLTALDFHYWTQPLPMVTSWYMAQLPQWFQKFSVVIVLVIEMGTPWLIFGPRVLRCIAFAAISLLMMLIGGTGNYNFFNLLTVVLAITMLDDKIWPQFLRRRIRGSDWPLLASSTRWRSFLLVPFAAFAIVLGTLQLKEAAMPAGRPHLAAEMDIAQFVLVNDYGLFRRMTETRPEIIVEGSADGEQWKPYEFRWKPGKLSEVPRYNTPHQPRLDWQMWFEALRLEQVHNMNGTVDPRYMSPWFRSFLLQLLRGEPVVLNLLGQNPFPDAPPKFIRIELYQYRFTDWHSRQQTGDWWERTLVWRGPAWSLDH